MYVYLDLACSRYLLIIAPRFEKRKIIILYMIRVFIDFGVRHGLIIPNSTLLVIIWKRGAHKVDTVDIYHFSS